METALDAQRLRRLMGSWATGVAVEQDDAGGVPVLAGAVAWVACELDSELPGGDHAIATGCPVESGGDPDASPLIFFRGAYGSGWWETTRSP